MPPAVPSNSRPIGASMAATAVRVSKSGNKYLRPGIPVFKDGEGRGNRQCTKDFKLIPIQRYAS